MTTIALIAFYVALVCFSSAYVMCAVEGSNWRGWGPRVNEKVVKKLLKVGAAGVAVVAICTMLK